MITREDFIGKTSQEIQDMMTKDVDAFGAEFCETASEEDLLNKEQELIKLMDDNKAYIDSVTYAVAADCTFDNQVFNKETAAGYIVDFLDSQEVEWSYTLGLYDLVKMWKNKTLETITYGAYDSTLRILGQLKFKGSAAWKKILVVNAFLSNCHEEYIKDTAYIIYLSQLHNTVLEGLKRFNPEPDTEETGADIEL